MDEHVLLESQTIDDATKGSSLWCLVTSRMTRNASVRQLECACVYGLRTDVRGVFGGRITDNDWSHSINSSQVAILPNTAHAGGGMCQPCFSLSSTTRCASPCAGPPCDMDPEQTGRVPLPKAYQKGVGADTTALTPGRYTETGRTWRLTRIQISIPSLLSCTMSVLHSLVSSLQTTFNC